jgi:predicted RND superfamily exporter protein
MGAERFFENLGRFIVKRPFLILFLFLAITIFLGVRVSQLTFDNSSDIWLKKDNPALTRLNEFRDIFGNEDFVYLVFEGQDFFEPKTLTLLKDLEKDLLSNLPFAKSVRWIGSAEYLEGLKGELIVSEISDFAKRGLSKDEIKAKVLSEKNYLNFLFDPKGDTIAFNVEFTPYPKEVVDPSSMAHYALIDILARPEYAELKPLAVGPPILHAVYNELSYTEALKFLAIGLFVMTVILYSLSRSIRDALVPLAIILISLAWAFGLTEVFGFTLNVYAILLPILLCCATVGDSMHIVELYRQNLRGGMGREDAVAKALGRSGVPCLVTALTSAAGFLSFLASDIPPCREMGVYASIGIMTAYVLSVFLTPMFYSPKFCFPKFFFPIGKKAKTTTIGQKTDVFDRFLAKIARFNLAHSKLILVFFVFFFALSIYGYLKVETESNTIGMLSKSLPLRRAYDAVDERLGGAMSLEAVVDSFEPDGIKDPEFLRKLDRLREFLEDRPEVTRTVSVIDLLKTISSALLEGADGGDFPPASRESTAQYLLLYELANGRELDKLISFDGQKARISARTKSLDTTEVRALSEALKSEAIEIFGEGEAVSITGSLDWTRSMNDQIALGQRQTFLAAFVTLTIIMALATRSLKVGILSLAPNVIPVLATIGFAGAMGIYVDIPLLCFCPIIIGLIIDDTTHFLHRFRGLFLSTGSYRISLVKTFATVGRPLTFTTMTVTGAFVFLPLSNLSGVSKFGGLGALAFVLALFADFFLLPSLLLTFKPFGPERAQKDDSL